MVYPEKVVFNELKWEYGWPSWQILRIIAKHKADGTYQQLCKALEKRGELTCTE